MPVLHHTVFLEVRMFIQRWPEIGMHVHGCSQSNSDHTTIQVPFIHINIHINTHTHTHIHMDIW